jgi:hypothetical protein
VGPSWNLNGSHGLSFPLPAPAKQPQHAEPPHLDENPCRFALGPRRAAIREGQQASKLERSKPAPLSVSRLRAVATALEGSKVIGPGVVARTCAELQRQFFDPPDTAANMPRSRRRI